MCHTFKKNDKVCVTNTMGTVFRDKTTGKITGYSKESGASSPTEVYVRYKSETGSGTNIDRYKVTGVTKELDIKSKGRIAAANLKTQATAKLLNEQIEEQNRQSFFKAVVPAQATLWSKYIHGRDVGTYVLPPNYTPKQKELAKQTIAEGTKERGLQTYRTKQLLHKADLPTFWGERKPTPKETIRQSSIASGQLTEYVVPPSLSQRVVKSYSEAKRNYWDPKMDIVIQIHEEARPIVESMPYRPITPGLLIGYDVGSGVLEDLKDKPGRTIIKTAAYAIGAYVLGLGGSLLSSAGIEIWKPIKYAVGYGLPLLWGGVLGKQVLEAPKGERQKEIGKILFSDVLPVVVGFKIATQTYPKIKSFFTVKGEKLELKDITQKGIVSGDKTFPTAPPKEHLKLFKQQKHAIPSAESPGGFHLTVDKFGKNTLTKSGIRESELAGLYISEPASPYFLRLGSGETKYFGTDIFPKVGQPSALWVEPKSFKGVPSFVRKGYGKKGGSAWLWSSTQAQKGVAYVPGVKGEIEAVIPPDTLLSFRQQKYYFKYKGTKVPVYEYQTSGSGTIKASNIFSSKGMGESYYSFNAPKQISPLVYSSSLSFNNMFSVSSSRSKSSYSFDSSSYFNSYKPPKYSSYKVSSSKLSSYKFSSYKARGYSFSSGYYKSYAGKYNPSIYEPPSYKQQPYKLGSYRSSTYDPYSYVPPYEPVPRYVPPYEPVPPPPPPTYFSGNKRRGKLKKKKKKTKKSKPRIKYRPSLFAIETKARGKAPKVSTGIEIRRILG